MLKRSTSLVALTFLSGTLALIGVACSSNKQTFNQSQKAETTPVNTASSAIVQRSPTAVSVASLAPKTVSPSPQPNQYELALDKADGAISISQSAQSSDDWRLVASQWAGAIALMQSLPSNSPYKAIAKTKIAQYQRYLLHAQQQANNTIGSSPDTLAATPDPAALPDPPQESPAVDLEFPPPNQLVFQAAIKRRISGTPVIDVTFNGTSKFEMIVDTGASGTVLTQETANALGLVPVAKAKANTASAKAVEFPISYVDSIQVGGALVKDVAVAIAPASVLETGLLGHDFFGNYDVTIKRDVVEFRPR